MKKTYLFIALIFFLFSGNRAFSQEKFNYPKSTDIGLNITTVLSSFLGNSNQDFNPDAFPLAIKLNRKKTAFRFGLGFNLLNSDDLFFEVEQVFFNNFEINARVGFERKKYLGSKIGFFYGLDVVGEISNEEDVVSNSIDITRISENGYGFGGGPIYGFEYYLNKGVYFGAEGSFYGIYKYAERKESFEFNPAINVMKTSNNLKASISAPTKLYIMVRF